MSAKFRPSCLTTFAPAVALLVAAVVLPGTTRSLMSAEPELRYVRAASGEKAEPVVAVDNVCAWPNLTVLADGTVVATIFNQPSHGQMAGDVECWAAEAGGKVWHKRGTPAPHEPDATRMNVAAGRAGNGDLLVLCSGWSNVYPPGKKGAAFRAGILGAWICRSADGGRTWSIDRDRFPAKGSDGGMYIPFGDILAGHDGQLRAAVYSVAQPRADRVHVLRSADDGRTWGEPVAMDPKAQRNETAMLHLGEGHWLAATRENGLFLYGSDDDARSWSPRMRVTGPAEHPGHLLALRDGRLLLSSGNRTPADRRVEVRFSSDRGTTWSEPLRVVDFQGDGGYPSSAELPSGEILTAYYASRIEGHARYHMGVVVWDPIDPRKK